MAPEQGSANPPPAAGDAPAESAQTQAPRRPRLRLWRWFGVLVVLAVLAVGGTAGGWFYAQDLIARPGPLPAETVVVVPRGAPVAAIATLLKESGVVREAGLFALAVRLFGRSQPLQAGEFAFPAAVSVREAMAILQSGATVIRRVTVPEGLTTAQVLALVADTEGLDGTLPADAPEGALLPETYHFSLGDERAEIVQRMQDAMAEAVDTLWADRAENLPFNSPEEAVIIASIVEKETGVDGERPRIAAVFINRLRRGMRLQSDPTVVYGLTGGAGPLERALTRADLQTQHPYNTYVIDGLPPGPIANAGRASLEAVLQPAQTNELYFVADGTGGHAFAETLEEHNRNVARWRKLRRQSSSP